MPIFAGSSAFDAVKGREKQSSEPRAINHGLLRILS